MIKEVAEVLAEKVKMTADELMTLSTPEKLGELKDKLKDGVFYSKTERDELMGNFRKSMKADPNFHQELLKDNNFRNALHPVLKGEILENQEQAILKKNGLEWKRGTDYSDIIDLHEKLITKKKEDWEKASPKDKGTISKEITDLEQKVLTKEKEFTDFKGEVPKKLANIHINYAFSEIEKHLDAADDKKAGLVEFLKYQWQKDGYSVNVDDNGTVTEVLHNGSVVKGEDFKPLGLSNVVEQIANKYASLKKSSSVKGWGGAPNNVVDDSDYKQFKSWEDVQTWYKQKEGKDLVLGSKEANEHYAKWQKAQTA